MLAVNENVWLETVGSYINKTLPGSLARHRFINFKSGRFSRFLFASMLRSEICTPYLEPSFSNAAKKGTGPGRLPHEVRLSDQAQESSNCLARCRIHTPGQKDQNSEKYWN